MSKDGTVQPRPVPRGTKRGNQRIKAAMDHHGAVSYTMITDVARGRLGGQPGHLRRGGQERIKAAYRGNYDRLARVKARYDPNNFFHVNQNIQPASQAGVGA